MSEWKQTKGIIFQYLPCFKEIVEKYLLCISELHENV